MAPAAYKALHPAATAPVIEDDAVVLAESGAIVDYILARYGNGRLQRGPDHPEFAAYLFWSHYANASLGATEMIRLVAAAAGVAASHPVMGFVEERSKRAFDLIEARLTEAAYFAGDAFTAADVMMVFGLTTLRVFTPRDLAPYGAVRAYLARIGERAAYQRAMAKGDPGFAPLLT